MEPLNIPLYLTNSFDFYFYFPLDFLAEFASIGLMGLKHKVIAKLCSFAGKLDKQVLQTDLFEVITVNAYTFSRSHLTLQLLVTY